MELKKQFDIIKQTREGFAGLIHDTPITLLNKIPDGFNNNIIWNFGHIISSQQILCYNLSNLPYHIDPKYFERFKSGTIPMGYLDQVEVQHIIATSNNTILKLQEDYFDNIFEEYNSFIFNGVSVADIEDAIQFVSIHDAVHYGIAMSIKKALVKYAE